MQCRAGRDSEVIRSLHCPRVEGFMESVVAWMEAGRGDDLVKGRPPGPGRGKEGRQLCLGHSSPFRVPGLDSVPSQEQVRTEEKP